MDNANVLTTRSQTSSEIYHLPVSTYMDIGQFDNESNWLFAECVIIRPNHVIHLISLSNIKQSNGWNIHLCLLFTYMYVCENNIAIYDCLTHGLYFSPHGCFASAQIKPWVKSMFFPPMAMKLKANMNTHILTIFHLQKLFEALAWCD